MIANSHLELILLYEVIIVFNKPALVTLFLLQTHAVISCLCLSLFDASLKIFCYLIALLEDAFTFGHLTFQLVDLNQSIRAFIGKVSDMFLEGLEFILIGSHSQQVFHHACDLFLQGWNVHFILILIFSCRIVLLHLSLKRDKFML